MTEFREYIQNRDFDKPFTMRDFTGFSPSALVGTEKLPLVKILEKKLGLRVIVQIPQPTVKTALVLRGTQKIPSFFWLQGLTFCFFGVY